MRVLMVLGILSLQAFSTGLGVVTGIVTDDANQPLTGATVFIEGTPFGTMTDTRGEYVITALDPGTYSITARMVGRSNSTMEGVTVEGGSTSRIDFTLTEDVSGSTVITVIESRSHILRDTPSTAFNLNLSDMKTLQTGGIIDVISDQPGVIQQNGAVHIRGGRSDEVDYLLDGISLKSPMDGQLGFNLPLNAVSQATLMTGGLSIEHGNSMSGVVNLIGREGEEQFNAQIAGRFGDVSGSMPLVEEQVFSESMDVDPCRTDIQGCDFSLSGSEPITGNLLPSLGINLPGKLTFNLSGQINFSGHNNRDTRHYWSYNWMNDASGILKLVYRPESGRIFSLSLFSSYLENGWNQWSWSTYGEMYCGDGVAIPSGDVDFALPAMFRETYGAVMNSTTILGERAVLNCTVGALSFLNWNRIYDQNGGYIGESSDLLYWITQYEPPELYQDTVGFYRAGVHQNVWFDSKSDVYSAELRLEINPNSRLRLKTGIGARYFDLYQYNVYYVSKGNAYISLLNEYPHSASAYGQGSYRFNGGGVLTLGVRGDYFNSNSSVFSPEAGSGSQVSGKIHVSPRVSFSVPFGERSLFFATYGHYFQIAPMNSYFLHTTYSTGAERTICGNPDLDPEVTRLYELGIRQELDRCTDLNVSFYSKDITGLISTQVHEEGDWFIFTNDDSHGNAMGMETSLTRRQGSRLAGQVFYTYSVAKGKYSSALQEYNYSQLEQIIEYRDDSYLDWDQSHQAGSSIEYSLPHAGGPSIAGTHFLESSSFGINWKWGSGTPYTIFPEGPAPIVANTERRPFTMQTDVSFSKKFFTGYGELTISLSVFNILNRRNIINIYDTDTYHSSGDPTGNLGNPRAWSPARHFLFSMVLSW